MLILTGSIPSCFFPMRLTAPQCTQHLLQIIKFVRAAIHPFSVQMSTSLCRPILFFFQNMNVLCQRLDQRLVCSIPLGRQRLKQQLADCFNTTWSPKANARFATGLAEWFACRFLLRSATTLNMTANRTCCTRLSPCAAAQRGVYVREIYDRIDRFNNTVTSTQ